ncbi:PaaI family thioesterase [Sphingomonas sp. CGMCC 1.13654]|uniref:Acyl-coenzyme A thioesterase THEM4 n=2 Tax=Sphingomonas chungangi TaxID=2683589 RepID=A0A838L7J6_9SPHN|nr:PaaI family thioesterase [Sphingomonas chungangi]MBA2935291.1 PaaI family thioesterase [Sphingomonas chungangi]MVW56798.1 PaaI family thioesterase [Sphingomonas chungangi]
MIASLRAFLNRIAGGRPEEHDITALGADLDRWSTTLAEAAVEETEQVYGRRPDLLGRGQATWPAVRFTHLDDNSLEGVVTFDRYFLGRHGVAHGGAIAFLFDEIAGRLAHLGGRPMARTGYLRIDFRAIAPIEVELRISGRYLREEGRKRILRLELAHGDTLCAEAEVLMVTLKPGQR